MKIAIALLVVLAGCAGPPSPPAGKIWLQHPALLSFKGQRRTEARLKRAAAGWLPATKDVVTALPEDAPERVRATMTNVTHLLQSAKRGDLAGGRAVNPLAAADLRNLLGYVKQECLSG